jgi:U3 small nucleolar RNA-associated protein MPP10
LFSTSLQPKARIETIANVASASLEAALPTSEATSTTLAPEEVFTPRTSDLRDRGEMTPAEKRSLRSKERKVRKRARDKLDKAVDKFARSHRKSKAATEKESKQVALKSVVKSGRGVTVVGNKLSSTDGKKRSQQVDVTGGALKL